MSAPNPSAAAAAGTVTRERRDKVLVVTVDHAPVNALSTDVRRGLLEAIEAAAAPASRRTSEIIINDFDARPAQRRQAVTHCILQGPAFAIVQNLMS